MKVPRFDPCLEDAPVRSKILDSIAAVIADGRFIGGPWVERLEHELSTVIGRSCVTVASGTDALTLGLLAAGIGEGGRVAVPAATFSATASAVFRAGATPVLVDIVDETSTIDWTVVSKLAGTLNAVIPVHLYGRATAPPEDLSCLVIEDACQAFGNPHAGHVGSLAAFSFFPTKPLGCYGDGGALVGDQELVERARILARHGATRRYMSDMQGFNSRLDAVQAAVLLVKLDRVQHAMKQRAMTALVYCHTIQELDRDWLRAPQWSTSHTWHIFPLRCDASRRDALIDHLRADGIDAVVQYPALHEQPAFSRCERAGPLRNAELLSREIVSIPNWSGMTDDQVNCVCRSLSSFQ